MRLLLVLAPVLLLSSCGEPGPPLKTYLVNGNPWGLTGYWLSQDAESPHVIVVLRVPDGLEPRADEGTVTALCSSVLSDPPEIPGVPPSDPPQAFVKLSKESRFLIFSSVNTVVYPFKVDDGVCEADPTGQVPMPAMMKR